MRIIHDLLDTGGVQTKQGDKNLADSLGIIVSAIVANILPFFGPIRDALAHIPEAHRLIRLLVPAVATTVCLYIVCARVRTTSPSLSVPVQGYRFAQLGRQLAKIMLIPVMAFLSYEMFDLAPRGVLSTPNVLQGYLCRAADGQPAFGITVEAFDSLDHAISVQPITVDDTGYFALALKSWSPRPREIGIEGACGSLKFPIGAGTVGRGGCSSNRTPLPPRPAVPMWSLACTEQ